MNRVSAPVAPPSRTTSRFTASKYSSNHARSWPPSASPYSLDHSLQVHLWVHSISASKCISTLTRLPPPSASLSSLDLGLQVHLQTRLIPACKCVSEFTRSRSPSASPHSLDPGLQVHLQTRTITASKYIFKVRQQVYGDTGVTEGTVTGSIYSADPGVDRHHLISISSYHTMKIHTLSFPTFGLTHSVRDFVDPRNGMDPQRRVVSYLLTRFLHSSSQHRSFSWIPFRFRETCGGVLMVGSLPSSSIVSPQRLPRGASLCSQWACPGAPPIMLDYHLQPDWL